MCPVFLWGPWFGPNPRSACSVRPAEANIAACCGAAGLRAPAPTPAQHRVPPCLLFAAFLDLSPLHLICINPHPHTQRAAPLSSRQRLRVRSSNAPVHLLRVFIYRTPSPEAVLISGGGYLRLWVLCPPFPFFTLSRTGAVGIAPTVPLSYFIQSGGRGLIAIHRRLFQLVGSRHRAPVNQRAPPLGGCSR